jgi:hypothetical protein
MVKNPVIQRYLSPDIWERVKKDLTFKRLVRRINVYGGEYSLQLREDYFNIYYRGNSLAKVTPDRHRDEAYTAEIHDEFLQKKDKPDKKLLSKLEDYTSNKPSRNATAKRKYVVFTIQQGKLYHFFQSNHLKALSSNIRKRGYGEEIAFEQVLITDNPPTEKFIIIDRQVADKKNKEQMDLLALKRDSMDKPFHFLVIEVKLGRNRELSEEVGEQLKKYIERLRKYIKDYVDCYKSNYSQKRQLGLFDPSLPNEIEIDMDEKTVEGLIVVGGYSGLADKARPNLCRKIKEGGWNIKVQQKRNEIKLDNGYYCEEPWIVT